MFLDAPAVVCTIIYKHVQLRQKFTDSRRQRQTQSSLFLGIYIHTQVLQNEKKKKLQIHNADTRGGEESLTEVEIPKRTRRETYPYRLKKKKKNTTRGGGVHRRALCHTHTHLLSASSTPPFYPARHGRRTEPGTWMSVDLVMSVNK